MPEINNSLALGIQQPDIGKTLLAVGQINALQAQTDQTRQNVDYNKFQQDQNGGYRVPDQNTLALTAQKRLEVQGQLGNMMSNAKTMADRQQVLQTAKETGTNIDPQVESHLLTVPLAEFNRYGQNMQTAGQTATANIEQTPGQIELRTNAAERARLAGGLGSQTPPAIPLPKPGSPPAPPPPTDNQGIKQNLAANTNADGSPSKNIGNSVTGIDFGKPGGMALATKEIEGRGAEIKGKYEKLVGDKQTYKDEAANATNTKFLLHQISDEASQFPTGKGAPALIAAKQWALSAAKTLGMKSDFVNNITNETSAAEAFQKISGQLTRATLKDVDGKAASEYSMIQKQLPNTELSGKGIQSITSQMMVPEDMKQARLIASEQWEKSHGSLDGFAADWNKNVGPGAFLLARLPAEERDATIARLNKTEAGRRTLQSINSQAAWVKKTEMEWASRNGAKSAADQEEWIKQNGISKVID